MVRLAGFLTSAQVPELLKACLECEALDLDLTDLVSADPAGLDALRRIRAGGASLMGTSAILTAFG